MKLQAHIPTVGIGTRDWRAPMIVLSSLFGAAVLMLTLKSGVLLDNPVLERLWVPSAARPHISVAHRVSLDFHLESQRTYWTRRFSVAHALPDNVASSQPFSIGKEERIAFEVFGETALRNLESKRSLRQLERHSDLMMLMLMLVRLNSRRN